jgi:chemotaxis protein MotA
MIKTANVADDIAKDGVSPCLEKNQTMDLGTIIGLAAGAALLLASILMASDVKSFIDFPSILMVGGGSICAALISFPVQHLFSVANITKKCFFTKAGDPRELIAQLVKYAETARRDGILALDSHLDKIDDPFIVQGIQMAVDGTDPDLIEAIMMTDLEAVEARHADGKALFDNIGRFAPAFGMIGTLVGLVIMLKNMADPASIGPSMAIAVLTTLYGAVISNMFALPLAEKLARRSKEELLLKMIVIKGVMAIQSGDNPRIVDQKLRTFLPVRLRRGTDEKKAA